MTKSKIVELYGYYTGDSTLDWPRIVDEQFDKYTAKRSTKSRKSNPEQTIGTTVVRYGKESRPLIIDPTRFYENGQVFMDCMHLLTNHEPGNTLYLVPEVPIPGGHVDFVLVSMKDNRIQDFVGIELQALDTTGTVWPERQKFLQEQGLLNSNEVIGKGKFGINWKMTAKTIMVQLHHKVKTFEHLNKHFVLIAQDALIDYIKENFDLSAFHAARLGDSMQFHSYKYQIDDNDKKTTLQLSSRISTDSIGLGQALGLNANAEVELQDMINVLMSKISDETLFRPMSLIPGHRPIVHY